MFRYTLCSFMQSVPCCFMVDYRGTIESNGCGGQRHWLRAFLPNLTNPQMFGALALLGSICFGWRFRCRSVARVDRLEGITDRVLVTLVLI
jgi:hypothetical protein